jgi:integrase
MENDASPAAKTRKPGFHLVAPNLYRLGPAGKYYALLKRGNKQFRRSLKTKDRKLAERRLSELRAQVGNLTITEDARLSFTDLARRWVATAQQGLKPASIKRRESCIKNLAPFFHGLLIRNLQPAHCERWVTERGGAISARTFVHELDTMRLIFDYAVGLGLMLSNPAAGIKRRRIVQNPIAVPTREQFPKLVAAMRAADGRPHIQSRAKHGADLVELLAYSGCRLSEATSLRWGDVDFEKGTLTITGGEGGTKNHEQRTAPMTQALQTLLARLREESAPQPADFVAQVDSAKNGIAAACRRLGYPEFTHHDFRHFFATTCIEAGVDIPTVSRWLGHKDGGALAMRVYGHLRQEHSIRAAQLVRF